MQCTVLQFFPTQWDHYLTKVQNEQKGLFYQHKSSPIAFVNNVTYVGGEKQFLLWALQEYRYNDKESDDHYRTMASNAYKELINTQSGLRSFVYFDIEI